jgi:hypothetical protein
MYSRPCKNVSHIQHSSLLISNPTHKTKSGNANRWETTCCNPPGPIKLCCQSTAGLRYIIQPQQCTKTIGPKPFRETSLHRCSRLLEYKRLGFRVQEGRRLRLSPFFLPFFMSNKFCRTRSKSRSLKQMSFAAQTQTFTTTQQTAQ